MRVTPEEAFSFAIKSLDTAVGGGYVFAALISHLHSQGLIDPKVLADALLDAADTAEVEASPEQAVLPRTVASYCQMLDGPSGSPPPSWLKGVIRGGKA
ncbi:TPA: hypothetical protein ACXM52_000316 [Stenotrophomonas maltophilia]